MEDEYQLSTTDREEQCVLDFERLEKSPALAHKSVMFNAIQLSKYLSAPSPGFILKRFKEQKFIADIEDRDQYRGYNIPENGLLQQKSDSVH